MKKQTKLRLTGSGGQGLILGGIILAEAALKDNKNAVQSQSYGPEARGGLSKAEVIISNEEINFPKVEKADLLLSLNQASCNKYIDSLDEDGVLIIDSTVKVPKMNKVKRVIRIPILETANEVIGKPMVANIVAIGAVNALLAIVSKEAIEAAVLNRVPKGTERLNCKSLEEGYRLIENRNLTEENLKFAV